MSLRGLSRRELMAMGPSPLVSLSDRGDHEVMGHTGNTSAIMVGVGVDGSESSIAVLRRAARIATALDQPVEAVTTWEYSVINDGYYPVDWSPEKGAKTIRDDAIAQVFPDGAPGGFIRTILQGSPARVLIEHSSDTSMLVLGSRGHGGLPANCSVRVALRAQSTHIARY